MTFAPLEFPAGVTNGSMQCYVFTVYDDGIIEYDEFFLVELTILTPGVMEGNTITNVTIIFDLSECEYYYTHAM